MKKRIFIVAIVSLCLLLLPLLAGAETVRSGEWGDLSWTLDDAGLLTISGSGPINPIEELLTDAWMKYRDDVKTVKIENGVTGIGRNAFLGCQNMTGIAIPGSVKSIGGYAFSSCNSLTDITIPEGVTTLGDCPFFWCDSLATATLPDSLTEIGANPFAGCGSLSEIHVSPDHPCLTVSNGVLFSEPDHRLVCYPATRLAFIYYIPDGTRIIEEGAFTFCTNIYSIVIPESVTEIRREAFCYCSSLNEIIIPNSVTSIGHSAFCYCASLTNVTISDGVTGIGSYAFGENDALASVRIPDSVHTFGINIFSNSPIVYCSKGSDADAWATGLGYPVVYTPVITLQPESVTVASGDTATFTVEAEGTDLTWQWYYLKPGEADWTRVSRNGTSATLSLTAAERHNGYFYRCTVTNGSGAAVDSDAAMLSVGVIPTITAQPEDVTAAVGEAAVFTVEAEGEDLSWQWYYQKPGDTARTKVSRNGTAPTLSVTVAARHNGYSYSCMVSNVFAFTFSDPATLTVGSKPVITAQPESVTVAAGSKATFKVAASGTGLKYQWFYLKPGASAWTRVSSNGTSASYSLTAAARHNGYSYRCKVSNAAGSVESDIATLTIGSKPAITTQPKSVTAAAGAKATFKVVASGTGLKYQWYYLKPGAGTWTRVSSNSTSASYSLTTAARHNGYSYRCKVTNAAGAVDSSVATLTIGTKPTITTQPKSAAVTAGSKATFKVVASGTGLKYQWYYLKPGAATWTKVSSNGTSAS